MINKKMNEQKTEQPSPKNREKVNEVGGFYFSSGIKIFDPNTKEVLPKNTALTISDMETKTEEKEVLVQKRGDN